VPARGIERQVSDPKGIANRKLTIEVREQGASSGRLPHQGTPQGVRIDGHKLQASHSSEMPGGGIGNLLRRRKMDVAVAQIDGRTPERS
jgi:hypothetical protein